ncbi:MAG: DUF2027 domain-containing protein [Muribaculaceae bacterium]|nr:DUF2027 domain-containing protein [Muribaculaceae bacterium]
MAKTGDRVRFLNSTGGGLITRIEGKTAYVEDEDGFETPILLKDIVVVMPAGHESAVKGSSIMFDQKAYDQGKITEQESKEANPANKETKREASEGQLRENEGYEETRHGDIPTILLAFEPTDIKRLSETRFTGVLVNDSNYFIDFVFLRRSAGDRGWEIVYRGEVAPNELIDLAVISHEDFPEYGRVAFQGIFYKKEKAFPLLPPLSIVKRIDLTKFHKLHCFKPSKYFDGAVLEIPLISGGEQIKDAELDKESLEGSLQGSKPDRDLKSSLTQGKEGISRKRAGGNHISPHKLLPLIEVDLHIGELTDSLAGLEAKDMLTMQLEEVRRTMSSHSKRIGQKIVFIHGKGEGVLRKAVLELLKKEYPKAELQDASFREYGFGATLVTVH